MVITLGNKDYTIKYGYEATVRSGLVTKLINNDNESVEIALELLPEMLLVGLQHDHADEFKFDYASGNGKEEALSKVYALLDNYFEDDESDFGDLYNQLQEEMTNNGFLAAMFRKAMQAEQKKKGRK